MSEEKTVGKVSQFFNRIGRKTKRFLSSIKISIENVATGISIKYLNLGTAYFNKKAKHLQNLKDREEFGRPMLRDIPKYIGIWIYTGFAAILTFISSSINNWRIDRLNAEDKKDSR